MGLVPDSREPSMGNPEFFLVVVGFSFDLFFALFTELESDTFAIAIPFHLPEIALHFCNRSRLSTLARHDEYLRLVVPDPVGSEDNSLIIVKPDEAGIGPVVVRKLQRLTALSLS